MIVVDASVAVKWILLEQDTPQAWALYRSVADARGSIAAPPLLQSEVANTLFQRTRRVPPLDRTRAVELLNELLAMPIDYVAPDGMLERALLLAADHNLRAVYDAHYLALAQMLDCELWTADQELLTQLGGRLPFVRRLGENAADAGTAP